jgi:putative ABC transport system permease protein
VWRYHFISGLRSLRKHRQDTIINVAGLALGLFCAMSALSFVEQELDYDSFHGKSDRIFRLVTAQPGLGGVRSLAVMWGPAGPLLKEQFPVIEESVRLFDLDTFIRKLGEEPHQPRTFMAEPAVFDLFDWEAISGDPKSALSTLNGMVLTRSLAERLFRKTEAAMNQTLTVMLDELVEMEVQAILEDVPERSHIEFEALLPYGLLFARNIKDYNPSEWRFLMPNYTYLLLKDPDAARELQAQFPAFVVSLHGEHKYNGRFSLQPLRSIHLESDREHELKTPGSYVHLAVFGGAGLLILILACFNFISLMVSQTIVRARGVGLRKILGGSMSDLVFQSLLETGLLVALAAAVALCLTWWVEATGIPDWLPATGLNLGTAIRCVALATLVGLLAGSLPALRLASIDATRMVSSVTHTGVTARRVLTTVQVSATVVLIASFGIIGDQVDYLMARSIGSTKTNSLWWRRSLATYT